MFDFLDQSPWLLPIIIFFGRIVDVSLGTLRIIFVSKGEKYKAPIIGFFEVFIWVVIISQILSRANDMIAYVSYAAGYAAGNYVGILMEQYIAYGVVLCRIYTKQDGALLVKILNDMGHGSTLIHATGSVDKVDVVETVIDRKEMKKIEKKLCAFDPQVFYVVEDVRTKQNGIFNKRRTILSRWRTGK